MGIENKIRLWNKLRKLKREKPQLYLFPECKFGYIQIPKVASRSIRTAVTAYMSGASSGEKVSKYVVEEFEALYARHLRHSEIAALSKDNFFFAFVRNPYERIYSCYKNKILDVRNLGGRNIFEKHGIDLNVSFEEFVRKVSVLPDHKSDRHFRSQAWFLTWKGELLPSFVGKLENMNDDWKVLQERFAIAPPPQINVSSVKPLPEMSSETKALIVKRYIDDFELFGYSQ
ncbi:sulfotransferase family 2 domain-containing protein [Thermodesulfobacteriota bacterium]